MKIKSLLPVAFGKFHMDRPINFTDGLNIVLGENEKGKSTLGAFILGMLYGFKKEGKTRISRTPEYERYRPWQGKEYRGVMVYEDEGRTYRVERWFDPDFVKIYDDSTGEDITGSFSQDTRKEYDFAQRHLGLSAREFKNTIWIGQLGSAQEPDLAVEIQGKLESVLQGGSEDLSLAKALSALNVERSKIKTPRSTRGRLDMVYERISELEKELGEAREREAQVREWLLEVSALSDERKNLEDKARSEEKALVTVRYAILQNVLTQAKKLRARISELGREITGFAWAKDLPQGCEEAFRELAGELNSINKRIDETKAEIKRIFEKREGVLERLKALSQVEATGLDESQVASLHSRYLAAKASASRGERLANEARKELRLIEEEGKAKGLHDRQADEDLIKKAEEYREIITLAEKEKDRLQVEVEKARAAVASVNVSGASSWLYGLALGILGIAILLTLMGMPLSIAVFGISLVVFGTGVFRQRKVAKIRSENEKILAQKESEMSEQIQRVENARKVLSEFLAAQGARSVEELRATVREVLSYQERLKSARDKYEFAHRSWFETSVEFSSVEKELVDALRGSGCLLPGEPVTEVAVESLKQKVSELRSAKNELRVLDERMKEMENLLLKLNSQKSACLERQAALFAEAGVRDENELAEKLSAHKRYEEISRELSELEARLGSLLSGRDLDDIQAEIERISPEIDGQALAGVLDSGYRDAVVSEKDYESRRDSLDRLKARIGDIKAKILSLENAISLRSAEGRSSAEIEEELSRQREIERELSEDRDALELAASTLETLSKNIRREFAPALNRRVGEILSTITRGKYVDVRVSPDLEMSVIHPDTQKQTHIALLSGGTVDQCYFALRVAVAEIITKKTEFPFFLDDPFVQYDDKRLEGVLEILSALSSRHQILLFSCHGREERLARKVGIECNVVVL
ncbi:MAG TPA: AAA family ATPase [Firmicutes bacterium]|nr:AAA family ATPase [Candidatus Fermentithermobacillaceae bacterium]